jgi:hypothetical protein
MSPALALICWPEAILSVPEDLSKTSPAAVLVKDELRFKAPANTEMGPATLTLPVKFRPAVLPLLPMTKPDRPLMGVLKVKVARLKLPATGSKVKAPAPPNPLVPSCGASWRITSRPADTVVVPV